MMTKESKLVMIIPCHIRGNLDGQYHNHSSQGNGSGWLTTFMTIEISGMLSLPLSMDLQPGTYCTQVKASEEWGEGGQ
jgi:hypothetical protein